MYLVVSVVLWGQFLVIALHFANLQEHGGNTSLGGCVHLVLTVMLWSQNSIICRERIIMVG